MNYGRLAIGVVFLILCAQVPAAEAAITADAATSASTAAATATTLSWSHTVSGSDRILIVGVSVNGNTAVSTVTFAGTALTNIASANQGSSVSVSLWYLVNPAAGTGTVTVTTSGSARFVAGAVSYTGVNQSSPLGTAVTDKGSASSASLTTTSVANDLVVDLLAHRGDLTTNPITPGAGQTARWNTRTTMDSATTGVTGGASEKAGAAVTMTWTWPTSRAWAAIAVPLKPVPPDTTAPVRSNGAPSGTLSSGTTGATLSLTTNENATCRYSTTSGVAYASMTHTFATTGGTSHAEAVTGLTDGTAYAYYVRCSDTAGNANTDDYAITFSVASPPPDTTPPSTPGNLHTTSVTTSAVGLAWDASTDNVGVAGYKVFRDSVQIATTSTTNYEDMSVAAGTTYAYAVRAYDAAGNDSAPTSALSVTTASSDTTAPVISSVTVTGIATSSATIDWQTDEPSTSRVEYDLTGAYSLSGFNGTLVTSHSMTLTSLASGATYHFRALSQDSSGNESATADHTFTTVAAPDTTPPHAITDLAVVSGTYASARLTWTAPSDDTGAQVASYDLRYATVPITDANWASAVTVTGEPLAGAPGEAREYTIAGLSPSTTYYVAVRSEDSAGNVSALSNVVSAATLAETTAEVAAARAGGGHAPLSPPSDFSGEAESGSSILMWKNPRSLAFVRTIILRKEGSPPKNPKDGVRIYEGDLETFTDTGLVNGVDYYYAAYATGLELNTSRLAVIKVTPQSEIEDVEVTGPSENVSPSEAAEMSTTSEAVSRDAYIPFDLEIGARGPAVSALQTFLAKDATLDSGSITGYFGPLTRRAVQKFQCAHGIACGGAATTTGYGRVGLATRQLMDLLLFGEVRAKAVPPKPLPRELVVRDAGDDVRWLQAYLTGSDSYYPEGQVTGYLGTSTLAAVEKFQCDYGIVCEGTATTTGYGRVGPITRSKLNALAGN